MINTVVARRYANAIFALGKKDGDAALSSRGECLANLGEMLAAAPGLDLTLKSPVIGVSEKKAVLDKLLTKLKADTTMRNFCFLLADKERLAFLSEIAVWYGKLLDEAKPSNGVAGHNDTLINVCYIGGVDAAGKAKDTRTEKQRASLLFLLEQLKETFFAEGRSTQDTKGQR